MGQVAEYFGSGNELFKLGKYEEAITIYEQGAAAGDSHCQTRLGKLLLWGEVTPKDEAQAYFWFCKAARASEENLARCRQR